MLLQLSSCSLKLKIRFAHALQYNIIIEPLIIRITMFSSSGPVANLVLPTVQLSRATGYDDSGHMVSVSTRLAADF